MNEWTWIFLGVLLAMYLLDVVAGWLNLRALRPELPEDFRDIYDREEYARLLRYNAITTRFGWIESTFSFVLLVGFWLAGGFNWLDLLVREWDFGPIISGLCFIGLLSAARTLVMLPFGIYDTFVIEQQFGFNKTTPATWILDQVRGLALGAILGGSVLALILWLLQFGGPLAWLWAWIATAAIMIVMVFLAPAFIMPLFNKFTPLEPGPLKDSILAYGEKEKFPIAGLFVMDGSRRSTRANAFFTGFGRTKKIVLFDTLIEKHTVRELVAVLAHEIGHFKLKHIVQHLAVSLLNIGILLFLASRFLETPALFRAFGVENMSVYAGLTLFAICYGPISTALSALAAVQSRKHEFDADRFAAETTGDPEAMVDALKKLSKGNLSNLRPHWLTVVLYHSHPPVLQRVEAIRRIGK